MVIIFIIGLNDNTFLFILLIQGHTNESYLNELILR